jgi:Fic family protein
MGWLEFFLDGVAETANQALNAATSIMDLFKSDRERIMRLSVTAAVKSA